MTSDPSIPTALREATTLRLSGRFAEAERAYRRVLAAHPDLADSWYNLGLVQTRLGRLEEALASYQEAIDRGVSDPEEAHLNRSVVFADRLRRDEDAERELEAALALNPSYIPALLNLGNLHEDRGRRAEALAVYERALSCDPQCWAALARIANASPPDQTEPGIVRRLQDALARSDVSHADRALLGFALGRALDGAGAFDAAFAAFEAANRASRASADDVRFDRTGYDRFIDALIAAFPAPAPPPAAAEETAPIFICGMFRSGSTLAEQALAAHPRVTAGGELGLIPAMAGGPLAPFPQSMATTPDAALQALAERYVQTLRKLFPGAEVVTDKRPDNFLYIGLVKRLFPTARIVHTVRDPLDTCLSNYFLHLDHGMSYALDLEDIAHYYRGYRRLMAHWRAVFGDDIFDLDYDELVRAPRPALERLLAHCGLAWDEGCLAFHEAGNAVKTASVWQVREPLYTRSSGRWRNYERHLGPLKSALERS